MATTIDLSQIGASQAALFARLAHPYPLPANASQFPLGPGQIYGQVATNCRLANSRANSNKGMTTRNHHRARGAISEIAMVLPNWYVDRTGSKHEYPNNAGIIYAASIEYPAGTFQRLTFTGSVRELAPGGGYLVSGFLPIAIPDNAEFWSNIWLSAASSLVFFNGSTGQVSANGERGTVSTGEVTDYTMSPHTGTGQTYGLWPLALLGRTSAKSTILLCDSIGEGLGDVADTLDHVGMFARLVGQAMPYINLSQSGDRLELALQSHSRRLAMLAYGKNAICGMGVNDIGAGRSLVQVKASMIAWWSLVKFGLSPGGRVFQSTITPSTTSSDSFATLENQTEASQFSISGSGTRELLNDWLRDGAPMLAGAAAAIGHVGALRAGGGAHPLTGVIEIADHVESARNSGKWRVDGTAFKWTTDGLHPSAHAHAYAALSAAAVLASFA